MGASQLIQKLKEYNNFDAHPAPRKVFSIASNLLLPVIFIGSLIFFSKIRRIFHLVEDNPQ
jgi:hypothetical protein